MKPLRPGLLPVIMLVVVIAWALFAVLMLTGTLISAQQIEDRVTVINAVYPRVETSNRYHWRWRPDGLPGRSAKQPSQSALSSPR